MGRELAARLQHPFRRRFEEMEAIALPRRATRFTTHGLGAAGEAIPFAGHKNVHDVALIERRHASGEESGRAHIFGDRGLFEGFAR